MLLIAAVPLIDMQLGQADAGTQPADTTQRRAYDLLAAGYGAGFNGPLLLVVDLGRSPDLQVVTLIREAVATDPGIAFVSPPTTNSAQDTVVLTAVPTTEPQARATSELVHRLRGNTLPSAVGFAEEFTRTNKAYGRYAVATPDDEEPSATFAGAAQR